MQRKQQLAAAEVVAACDRGARVHRDLQALMVVFFLFYFIGLTDLLTMFMDTVLYQQNVFCVASNRPLHTAFQSTLTQPNQHTRQSLSQTATTAVVQYNTSCYM